MSDLKLESGKFYETRDGRKAYVAAVNRGPPWPCSGSMARENEGITHTWRFDGAYVFGGDHPDDLIKPWRDEPKFKVGDRVVKKGGRAQAYIVRGLFADSAWIQPEDFETHFIGWHKGLDTIGVSGLETAPELASPEPAKVVSAVREAALIEERDALAAKVARVEALSREWNDNSRTDCWEPTPVQVAARLRNALNPPAKPELKRVKGWVNAYSDGIGKWFMGQMVYETRELALKHPLKKVTPIACIEIDVVEGAGL